MSASGRQVDTNTEGMALSRGNVSHCSGDMTLTSRAAGRPRYQFGRRISAGRALEPGTRLGASLVGPRAAD